MVRQELVKMAKKNTRTAEDTTTAPAASAPKRRAAPRKNTAAPAIDVATVGGTEPLATASDNSGANNAGNRQPTHDEIAEAAYFRHLNRGGADGDEFNDWVEAERELRERRR
jgi:hypothetical protein